ncbi:MAG: extracellular solute-binding protein [Chloroflexi bacterium]|nr:extracellular solute-binding protein [Chloroflexota bacterium]
MTVIRTLLVTIAAALLGTLVACAPAAVPPTPTVVAPKPVATSAPSPPSSPTPVAAKPAATAAPPSAPTTAPSALAQVIEGAKKEGQVTVSLTGNFTKKGLDRLRDELKQTYGFDLRLEFEPATSYAGMTAKIIAEHKAGAKSTYDLIQSSDVSVSQAVDAGAVLKVDWKPLLAQGTAPETVQWDGHALQIYSGHVGLVFNPRVIPPSEAPKSFVDLSNPKWQGKMTMNNSTSNILKRAIVLGVDRSLSDLRAVIKNQPVLDTYAAMTTRYLSGEYPLGVLIGSPYYENIRRQNYPVEWRSLDISDLASHVMLVLKNSAHPNSAMLVALFIASPQGRKLVQEEANGGSIFYSGNYEYEIHQQDVKAGMKVFSVQDWPGAKDFLQSDKGKEVDKEIGEIMKGR